MKTVKETLVLAAAATFAVAALSGGLGAASATEEIKARQEAMEAVGDSLKNLAAIAKKEAPFDAAVVAKNATTIAESLKKAEPHFPPGSDKGDVETWAKADIWSDPDMFHETMKKAQADAAALATVTDEAAFRPALGKLGGNCKDCHDMYRRPKH
jgi:cytochrome c556